MNRVSATSDRSGYSIKGPPSSRFSERNITAPLPKEPPVPKLKEWKHVCPCDQMKNQEILTVSTQCLCEEIDLKKELTLFFYNAIMKSNKTGDYVVEAKQDTSSYDSSYISKESSLNYGQHGDSKEPHQVDIRKLSREDKKNMLIGTQGGDVLVKRTKKRHSHSKGGFLTLTSRSSGLQPITENNPETEKLISTTNFEYEWLVKRDEKYAKITFKNGNRYEGEVLDKLPHGIGTFNWADGTVYEGEFVDGSPTGRGRMQLPDLTEYTGLFYKGLFHGSGVYNIRTTNMVYSGNWKYGQKHGYGWLLYESGVWYEGEFRDDLRHGKGFFQFKDNSCYQGEYSQNRRDGRGAMRWFNNDIYIGGWSKGVINGFGEYSWGTEFDNFFSFPVQNLYKGSWVNGKRTGTGIMFFGNENGAKMAGVFQDNFKHGAAIVMCGNGKSVEKNPLFYNDKPFHTSNLSNEDIAKESSSVTCNEQLFESILKNGLPEKQWPGKNQASKVATLLDNAKQERGALCSPIEIQIQSPPDDIDMYFYIEKALGMYVNAFDTIQFDIESLDTGSSSTLNASKYQLSKWNLMTMNSAGHSKVNRPENQGRHSFNQNVAIFNKSESRFQSTVRSEEKYLRNVITRYLPRLMEVYYHYATITSPKKIYFKHYMIRMFLWQLYLDIGITRLGISLVEIDKLLDENPSSFVESCHHPFEHIYFFQFVQSLMGTALLVHHRSKEEVHSSEGLMPYIFQKFLLENVFALAGTHRGRCLFEYKDILSMKNVYALYVKLGQPHTARTFLNATCTKKKEQPPFYKAWSDKKCESVPCALGKNVNIIGHNFFYIPEKSDIGESAAKLMEIPEDIDPFFQDLTSFRVLGPKVVVKCLATICPSIMKNGIICNMDYPMTFLEFYEVLICCALLMIARNKKKKDSINKNSSGVNKTDEEDVHESEVRKSSFRITKRRK